MRRFCQLRNEIIFIAIMLWAVSPAYAALDIFYHPKDINKKEKEAERRARVNFLDYPNECFLKGNHEEALSSCQRLLSLEPAKKMRNQILYLAGLSLLKLNRSVEARGYFNDALLIENLDEDMRISAGLGLAESYFVEENFDKADASFKRILTEYPRNRFASLIYYRLGRIMEKTGRPDEAREYYNKVRQEFPLSFEARLAVNPDPAPAPVQAAAIETGDSYTIQVGCFGDRDNADKVCEQLVRQGFGAYIYTSGPEDEPKFHVRVGRLTSKEDAAALENKLKKAGYPTKIYP